MAAADSSPPVFLNAAADEARHRALAESLGAQLPELRLVRPGDDFDPRDVRHIFTWAPMPDWAAYPNLRTVFSVSAGVDQFAQLPARVRLIRMVDPNNTRRVREFVLAACLACLRELPAYADQQRRQLWQPRPGRFIADTRVGVLGLGEIGRTTAEALTALGFEVHGWARRLHRLERVQCHAGEAGLSALLGAVDIVVCLLPLTPETRGILNAALFRRMRPGSALVHVGRGAHCVLDDLRAALESGQLSQALLDVFEHEPLPPHHDGWTLPNCLVTPHVAGRIDPATATANITRNLLRERDGLPLLWQVDRSVGY